MQTKPIEASGGKYRWQYKTGLFETPRIFLKTAKVLLIAIAVTMLIIALISLIADGFTKESLAFLGKLALIMLGIFAVLLVLGYLLYAAIMGGQYVADFEMDENELVHSVSAKQAEKAKNIGILTALMGLFAHNRGAVSAGYLSASRTSSATEFKRVKKVVVNRKKGVIRLKSVGWNEAYADGEDLDFVSNWIRERVPQTAEWVVRG